MSTSPPSVSIGPLKLGEQWVDFYALLAIVQLEEPGVLVTAERVHRLAGWKLKQPGSVGKEIARHMSHLRRSGLGQVVFSPSKTKAWRLGIDSSQVRLTPSMSSVSSWLAGRVAPSSEPDAWGRELARLVRALIALRRGRASDADEALGDPPGDVSDTSLRALRALLRGRIAYVGEQDDPLEELDALVEAWARSGDPAGRAVEIRLRALQAMRERFDDAGRTRATLTKLATDLEIAGDAGSLGVLLNVLGVLERRSGNAAGAFEHVSRAAALLAITGDHHTLQAALYNAALAHASALKQQRRPPDALSFSLLELCLEVCRELHVGDDSALAELTRAEWSLDAGRLAEAEAFVAHAQRLLVSTEVSYDQAVFLQVRGRLLFEKGAPMSKVTRDLKAAARIYGEVGDARAERRVTAMWKRFSRARTS